MSKVHLVLPPEDESDGGVRRYDDIIAPVAAFQKLEQYNEMIGAPRLMVDARFEFVPITILI